MDKTEVMENTRAGLYAMVKAIKKSPYTDEQIEKDIDDIFVHLEELMEYLSNKETA